MSTTPVERYAGVDVSKARLDVAVRPTDERYSVATTSRASTRWSDVSMRRALSWRFWRQQAASSARLL